MGPLSLSVQPSLAPLKAWFRAKNLWRLCVSKPATANFHSDSRENCSLKQLGSRDVHDAL